MKLNHSIPALALAFASMLPSVARADEGSRVPYTYAELGFVTVNSAGASDDGLLLRGDLAFNGVFYGVGDFSDVGSATTFGVGAGAHTALTPALDLFGELRLVSVDFGGGSDDGFELSAGLRGMVSSQFELSGRFDRVDVGGASDNALTIGGVYYFTPGGFGAFAEYTANDPADALTLGVRFVF